MKIYLSNQYKHLHKHLKEFKSLDNIPYDRKLLTHKVNSIELDCKFSDFNFNKLFDYHIFPSNILLALPQWVQEKRSIQVGDTIAQQINIPPSKIFSQKIIVGVRVKEIINKKNCKGFSYETLQGHVEKGVSLFQIEQLNDKVIFKIETYSTPYQSLMKLFRPITSWYQDYCTKKALRNLIQ